MSSKSNLLHSVSLTNSPPRGSFPAVLHQIPTSQANSSDEDDDGDLDPAEFLSNDVMIHSGSFDDGRNHITIEDVSGPSDIGAPPSRSPIDQIPTLSEHEFFLNPLVFSDKESLGFVTVDNNNRRDESTSGPNSHPNSMQISRQNTPGYGSELKPGVRQIDRLKSERYHKYSSSSLGSTGGDNLQNSLEERSGGGDPSVDQSILDSFRLSSLLPHTYFDIQRVQDSPVEYLINREKLLEEEVSLNLKTQKKSLLLQGQGNLARIRKMILQDFEQLADNGNMLAEAYSSELRYVVKMYESFEAWNIKRDGVLQKISEIKSSKSKYGSKLETLANESDNIDAEMEELQAKLAALRQKKKAIVDEIQQTSSILESRTLSFVETFRHLETEGEVAIRSMLDLNGVGKLEQDKFIQRTPVDVSFGGRRRDREKTIIKGLDSTSQVISSSGASTPNGSSGDGPFHKGFVMGSKQTTAAKKKLVKVFTSLILHYDGVYSGNADTQRSGKPQLDDASNTIQSKLSYEHIRTLLQLKILALQDVIQENKDVSTICTECSIVWKDVVSEVQKMESSLYSMITHSTSESMLADMTSQILETSIRVLRERVEMLVRRRQQTSEASSHPRTISDFVLAGIFNEAGAICSALKLVTGNNTQSQQLEVLKQRIGFNDPNMPIRNTRSIEEPIGYLNQPIIDYRQQAETELAKASLENTTEEHGSVLMENATKDKML